MKRLHKYFSLIALAIILVPAVSWAENSDLPDPLISHSTVSKPDGSVYYAGMGANEVILNHDTNLLLGFDQATLVNCAQVMAIAPFLVPTSSSCFKFDTGQSAMKMMTSRSYFNDDAEVEIAALFSDSTIIGDVSGVDSANFALYGKNLNKMAGKSTTSVTGESWKDSTAYNPDAQASYSADQAAYFDNHIKDLQGEALSIGDTGNNKIKSGGNWYLQSDLSNTFNSGPNNLTNYPEGRVWAVTATTPATTAAISGTNTYKGKGTIVVDGNLNISNSATILKAASNDSLGIIVRGDLSIGKDTNIQASMFVTGAITFAGDNVNMAGSFMANNFVKISRSGIHITYDYRLEGNWPPGFRYFDMPMPQAVAP